MNLRVFDPSAEHRLERFAGSGRELPNRNPPHFLIKETDFIPESPTCKLSDVIVLDIYIYISYIYIYIYIYV